MASIFTYQEEPHRLESPWPGGTPRSTTPQLAIHIHQSSDTRGGGHHTQLAKLEPEKHDGPIEYKLHLLLRWRRTFTHISTTMPVWANQQGRMESVSSGTPTAVDAALSKVSNQPSTQTRQARLQQLTTQLLWRLQQSSPFHSSSNAKLILPVLPEATPRLGVPERPSKLLPGLEESQGALYEIGVADDGTLVGLADEEMEESLTNLRAMAASLGCVVDVHRRVIVGDCEWKEENETGQVTEHSSRLWVAEVLVRPDNKSIGVMPSDTEQMPLSLSSEVELIKHEPQFEPRPKQHLRVAIVGASGAGKSSLLGTLTTSVLDNGRGKSRLSLLKHRHEIASGVTSSVAQELLGYQSTSSTSTPIVNYASGDVSSWPDIHNLADRLVFMSDSPGAPKFSKSTFRALISWHPAWTLLCVPADEQIDDNALPLRSSNGMNGDNVVNPGPVLAFAYMDICLRLGVPLVIVITKLDVASKSGLRVVLSQILTAVKSVGRSPVLVNAPSATQGRQEDAEFASNIHEEVLREHDAIHGKLNPDGKDYPVKVPIVMTSAVTGSGIASIHALLKMLPISCSETAEPSTSMPNTVVFRTDEVFAIPPSKVYSADTNSEFDNSGVVLCGVLDRGTISLGDVLMLGPFVTYPDGSDLAQSRTMRRTSSHQGKSLTQPLPRSLSETFSRSLQLNDKYKPEQAEMATFLKVIVVSLRNLRLPVTAMSTGDTGTVGIQVAEHNQSTTTLIQKARKGMILSHPADDIAAVSAFTACFPASDFVGLRSPPLILGGHAIAYIHTVRAVVKVTAVALDDDNADRQAESWRESKRSHEEVFAFEEDVDDGLSTDDQPGRDLRISFRLVNTVEALNMDDQVVVIPNMTPAGPVTGPTPASIVPGLSGFVGRICQLRKVQTV